MPKLIQLSYLFFVLCSSATVFASAEEAFKTLQSFKGVWTIESGGTKLPIQMTYDWGSKNSVVIEQFGKELSVIYKDGDRLLLTHFCNAGNQPRLQLKPQSSKDILEFELIDITNLKSPDAPYVHRIIYQVVGPNQIEGEWIWKKSSSEESEKYVFTRVP